VGSFGQNGALPRTRPATEIRNKLARVSPRVGALGTDAACGSHASLSDVLAQA
jgi:hypothetical protein